MMVPFGLLATGAFATGRHLAARVLGAVLALLLGIGFVLAVNMRNAFPAAHGLAELHHCPIDRCRPAWPCCFHSAVHRGSPPPSTRRRAPPAAGRAAILGFVAFALFPYDVALTAGDLAHRFGSPAEHAACTAERRPAGRAAGGVAGCYGHRGDAARHAAAASDGTAWRSFTERSIGKPPALAQIAATGAALLAILFGATLFVLSARVSILTFGLRLVGVVGGAEVLLRWLAGQDLARARLSVGTGPAGSGAALSVTAGHRQRVADARLDDAGAGAGKASTRTACCRLAGLHRVQGSRR